MPLPRSIATQEISRCFSASCSDEGDIVIVFVEITSRQHWSLPQTRGCLTFEKHCQFSELDIQKPLPWYLDDPRTLISHNSKIDIGVYWN